MSGPLPSSVHTLLERSQFLHLATCADNVPHVSLMNYVLLGPGNCPAEDQKQYHNLVLVSTPVATRKYANLAANPRCALLVHDWVQAGATESESGSSVLKLLQSFNQSAIGELSATLDAEVVEVMRDAGSDKYQFFKNVLLKDTPNSEAFVNADDVALILLKVVESKVSDSNNNINSYK